MTATDHRLPPTHTTFASVGAADTQPRSVDRAILDAMRTRIVARAWLLLAADLGLALADQHSGGTR
jgi:hypothetical protein